ncbi:helix-turn-helix domain-containing protein [Labilibacter marinus]|uniref:helix-turn-helix transcriptional regulator n=1 Tax=Labilibacter marinus TaxID=1477105 RepID=UPI00094F5E1E|nr:helix-turn-helix transcriptional regulator [Labilibacter marinus]
MHLAVFKSRWFVLCGLLVFCFQLSEAKSLTKKEADSILKKAEQFRYSDAPKALEYYNECIAFFEAQKDTVQIIKIKQQQVSIYSGIAQYQKSYDVAWGLLPYVQSSKYAEQHIILLQKIITLYMIYEQFVTAEKTIDKSFQLIDAYVEDEIKKADFEGRLHSYRGWLETETSQNLSKAEGHILKALELFQREGFDRHKQHYTKLQLAQLYIKMYKLKEADAIMHEVNLAFENKKASVFCLLYEYRGRYYQRKSQADSAIYFYHKAIDLIDFHKVHISNKVDILNGLSDIYAKEGNAQLAYDYIVQAKALSDSVFSSTSAQNKKLFEIKDQYEMQLRNHEEEIKSQKLAMLQKEKQFWLVKLLVACFLLLIIVVLIWLYFKRKAQAYYLEQKYLKQQQDAILEIKNKELLSSALQLIERDTQQQEIKKKLESLEVKKENVPIIKQIIKSLNFDKSKKWKEFETHFTAVNNVFYTSLQAEFPKLTATDLKICAFINLGFSSKDMAQIMGIGVEGINTTRSRLRKKMNLNREVVLADFLQSFGVK